ncbi:hypothetical protein BpHYR1_050555 [Brachionus plicatilis]|uniref:Transmembrane protein n=1 Tax=Brachionus plicatilis TaxID=10195 RepID=A0A3M7PWV9_BRAPC|nr:hypothetical protein BpHYR1_050555 [Brachionus plicatilis]
MEVDVEPDNNNNNYQQKKFKKDVENFMLFQNIYVINYVSMRKFVKKHKNIGFSKFTKFKLNSLFNFLHFVLFFCIELHKTEAYRIFNKLSDFLISEESQKRTLPVLTKRNSIDFRILILSLIISLDNITSMLIEMKSIYQIFLSNSSLLYIEIIYFFLSKIDFLFFQQKVIIFEEQELYK